MPQAIDSGNCRNLTHFTWDESPPID